MSRRTQSSLSLQSADMISVNIRQLQTVNRRLDEYDEAVAAARSRRNKQRCV